MNKKIIAQFYDGVKRYCVLSTEKSFDLQLTQAFGYSTQGGTFADLCGDRITISDIYHQETRTTIPVVAIEDCEDAVNLEWTEI